MSGSHTQRAALYEVLDDDHQRIADLARQAQSATTPTPGEPRLRRRLTDTFSGVLSQHLAAVDDVFLPEANRHLPAGHGQVHAYVRHVRGLEQTLHQLKARVYGDATSAQVDWDAFWREMTALLKEHAEQEHALAKDLVEHMDEDAEHRLALRLRKAEINAPTRPHPFTPHTGVLGRLSHRFWRIADSFWDHAEGRLVPRPPEKPPRRPDSLMHRYMTGAPAPESSDSD